MRSIRRFLLGLAAGVAALGTLPAAQTGTAPFALRPNDHICIIGNTLAERMQFDGWLETALHARFPRHDLVVRNLGWSGDEIDTRLREMNFGTPDEWLSGQPAPIGGYSDNRFAGIDTQADVIFAFFGYNESYAGAAGLAGFKQTLDDWIVHTLAQKYNGTSAPRVVLFSPIAHENLHNPDLPDGAANNERLALYTAAMREVAAARAIRFVDLFTPTRQAYQSAAAPLTTNGIHLNAAGNRVIAGIIDRALFGPPPSATPAFLEQLRELVVDKNTYWYNRYRVTDGYSTYGERAFLTFIKGNVRNVNADQVERQEDVLPTNYEVLERELAVLDAMTANRDRRIWAAARGALPPASALRADDADTPPFIDAGTNEPGPGPNGEHVFLPGDEATEQMTVAPGLDVRLFASEAEFPELVNPVQIAFDTRGRLWVASWKTYPHWQPKSPMDDKLLILEDTNGDGRADKRTVFAGDLHNPTGFEFYNGGVILAQAPNLVFLKDTDGDDRYDTRQILLSGFDTADTHHTINSFTFDPGGALYLQEGLFMRSQIETPWGPTTRESDGAVFRFEPRTSKLDVYIPMNFPNPHGHVFDYWGRDIVNDATNSQPYYGPALSTKREFPAMVPKAAAPKPGDIPGRSTGGTEILSSRHFPESLQGNFLALNVITHRGILNFTLGEDGAGLKSEMVDPLLVSADQSFRPVDAEVGPDGALYVADWQNPIIGHMQHNLRDSSRDHQHGRIYRVTARDRPLLQPAAIAGQPIPHLLDLLEEPENRVRYRAKIELSGRDTTDVLAALKTWVAALDPRDPQHEHHLLEALWVQQWHNRVDEALLRRLLRSPEPLARAAATRVLCYWADRIADPLALLKELVHDDHPAVRLEAVRALSFLNTPAAAAIALESLDHPQDRFLSFVLDQTMATLKPSAILRGGSPQAFEYQVRRLTNDELAALDRRDDDPRDRVVYEELLTRRGLSRDLHEEGLAGLVKLDHSTPAAVLLHALTTMEPGDPAANIVASMLLAQAPDVLRTERAAFVSATEAPSSSPAMRAAYGAWMIADGSIDEAWAAANSREGHVLEIVQSAPLLPPSPEFDALRDALAAATATLLLDSAAPPAAVRTTAVRALLALPDRPWPADRAEPLVRALVANVSRLPPPRRAGADAAEAIQLANRLLGGLADPARAELRRDLRALGVQIVRIETVPEQMRFSRPWFVVERSKSVQVQLVNLDTMPHNLVIGQPGALEAIGTAAMKMAMPGDPAAKAYVPDSPLVLQSTRLVREGDTERLTFTAPATAGEYVYACTFPGHWTRMYGVMLVVDSLDAWEQSPTTPIDPMTRQPFPSSR